MFITLEEIVVLVQDLSPSLDVELIREVLESVSTLPNETAYFELSKACADKTIMHPDWALLVGRIQIHGLRQQIKMSFSDSVNRYPVIYCKEYADVALPTKTQLEETLVPYPDIDGHPAAPRARLVEHVQRHVARLREQRDITLRDALHTHEVQADSRIEDTGGIRTNEADPRPPHDVGYLSL